MTSLIIIYLYDINPIKIIPTSTQKPSIEVSSKYVHCLYPIINHVTHVRHQGAPQPRATAGPPDARALLSPSQRQRFDPSGTRRKTCSIKSGEPTNPEPILSTLLLPQSPLGPLSPNSPQRWTLALLFRFPPLPPPTAEIALSTNFPLKHVTTALLI